MATLSSHERPVIAAILALGIVLALFAPAYFSGENLQAIFLANVPVLIVALGMTLVVLTGEIDISVGSAFAVCSVTAGVLAKAGLPALLAGLGACVIGAAIGSLNGVLVAYLRLPSIVVTLAAMVALRDGLRWVTQGAWVQDLPPRFQWFGLPPAVYPMMAGGVAVAIAASLAWGLRNVSAGRAVYAVGSNREGARLAGLHPALVIWAVFAVSGALTGLAAALNAARFSQIPSNTGLGLEMKVIAAVVVGGAAITGGRGRVTGTVFGVVLLGLIGPALTFLGVSAYWERALQGGIILVAVAFDRFHPFTAILTRTTPTRHLLRPPS